MNQDSCLTRHLAKAPERRNHALTHYKVIFDLEPDPDMSWLDQWNTPATYKGNEVYVNGQPVPWTDYRRYWGDPDRHRMLIMLTYELKDDDDDWQLVDSLGNIDFMDDDNSEIGTFYRLADISHPY